MSKNKNQPVGIKIPTIRQLPSGSWFCQLRINGQSISITDENRDVVEAKTYAYKAGVLKARKSAGNLTVGQAVEHYIRVRENIVSPSTHRGYLTIKNTRFKLLQSRRISELTKPIVQRDINNESLLCSAKTLQNSYALIASAIVEAGGERFDIKLKQVPPAQKLFLTPEQIAVLLEAIKGDRFEIPILLGLWSLRRSEIMALRWSDIDLKLKIINVSRGAVFDSDGQLVEKDIPKNKSSVRTIPICQQLYDALQTVENKDGPVVDCYPNSIYKAVNRICEKHGLPKIGIHGLRHSFASLAYKLDIPAKVAQAIGGWETDEVMLKIYTHISKADISQQATKLTEYFDAVSNANENANKNANTLS